MTQARRSMLLGASLVLLAVLVGHRERIEGVVLDTEPPLAAIASLATEVHAVVGRPVEPRADHPRPLAPTLVAPLVGAALLLALWRPTHAAPTLEPLARRHRSVGRRAPPSSS